jgi:5-bromo-4-chloroindolyl phosphate hydrolysis protein
MAVEGKTRRKTTKATSVSARDMEWIKEKLTEIDDDLKALKQTVIGNKEYGQKGLVEQVNEHRKYLEADKHFKAKDVGGSLVVGTVWTLLLKFWDKIFI